MILVLIGLFAVAFFMAFVFITHKNLRIITAALMFIALVGSLTAMIQNDKYHFGMEKVTATTTKRIYTASPKATPVDLLIYQPVGTTGKENVYVYKNAKHASKTHTQTDGKTVNRVFYSKQNVATLETTTVRYRYVSKWGKVLFGLGDNETVVTRKNTFILPMDGWLRISVANAKRLGLMMQNQTPAQKTAQALAGKAYVMAAVQAAIKADPKLAKNKEQQAKVAANATKAYQKMLFIKTINQLEKA